MTINQFPAKMCPYMSETFEKKCEEIKKQFVSMTPEMRYNALIELGRSLPAYPNEYKTADRIVSGCQSILYLHCFFDRGKCFFQADADALISKGLAAILIAAYSEETPETILKCPPTFISEIGIGASLSPNRSNGLAQIHLRMKQEALKCFL